jgi:hypothetical protein
VTTEMNPLRQMKIMTGCGIWELFLIAQWCIWKRVQPNWTFSNRWIHCVVQSKGHFQTVHSKETQKVWDKNMLCDSKGYTYNMSVCLGRQEMCDCCNGRSSCNCVRIYYKNWKFGIQAISGQFILFSWFMWQFIYKGHKQLWYCQAKR